MQQSKTEFNRRNSYFTISSWLGIKLIVKFKKKMI